MSHLAESMVCRVVFTIHFLPYCKLFQTRIKINNMLSLLLYTVLFAGCRGRPKLDVSLEQLKLFVSQGFTVKEMARLLQSSTSYIYKALSSEGLNPRATYSNVSQAVLNERVRELQEEFSK